MNFIDITEEQIELILTCRKFILTDSRFTCIKNYTDSFDIPMDSFNSAQIADLIGIYILETLGKITDLKQIGLYRDNGFIFISDSNSPKTSKIHKKVMRAFKLPGFKIEIASNHKIVNFLYITFDLTN